MGFAKAHTNSLIMSLGLWTRGAGLCVTHVILVGIIPSRRPDWVFFSLFFGLCFLSSGAGFFRLGRLCSIKLLGIRSFYNDEILCGCELNWAEFHSCFLFHAPTPKNRSPLFCLNDEPVVSRGNLFSGSTLTETLMLVCSA